LGQNVDNWRKVGFQPVGCVKKANRTAASLPQKVVGEKMGRPRSVVFNSESGPKSVQDHDRRLFRAFAADPNLLQTSS